MLFKTINLVNKKMKHGINQYSFKSARVFFMQNFKCGKKVEWNKNLFIIDGTVYFRSYLSDHWLNLLNEKKNT